jgi:hypothetical protein
MAVAAVLLNRSMLPQERTALFRVAVIALLINGIALQITGSGRTMRLVTVCTSQQTGM